MCACARNCACKEPHVLETWILFAEGPGPIGSLNDNSLEAPYQSSLIVKVQLSAALLSILAFQSTAKLGLMFRCSPEITWDSHRSLVTDSNFSEQFVAGKCHAVEYGSPKLGSDAPQELSASLGSYHSHSSQQVDPHELHIIIDDPEETHDGKPHDAHETPSAIAESQSRPPESTTVTTLAPGPPEVKRFSRQATRQNSERTGGDRAVAESSECTECLKSYLLSECGLKIISVSVARYFIKFFKIITR
ncbi:uncharacterized protein PGTG_22189 [Puccinia graminis f. sp. tritici CRL 75-36-700-3]|uniref:Uncharacterized protein n=1 Tax=Puccinia graminis f. sp. tritici (strain CRL 75-36-700-3 / race SCCL) TaxID=418459 RepID=H6QTV5_PUCGT|nr:uncharacterized protein PGTG_22189 [Puccinia graminis f. sp. tritici CRL 75-36-700-3]EHS64365.1 hypothetical protein PGTG_22189 [Puccinia graminis f. sp. tritici CRL 75-36-700-3]